jgi:uncharacterized Zn finger protein
MRVIALTILGDSGTEYEITTSGGSLVCTCPAYTYGGGADCKHIKYVINTLTAGLEGRVTQEAACG